MQNFLGTILFTWFNKQDIIITATFYIKEKNDTRKYFSEHVLQVNLNI